MKSLGYCRTIFAVSVGLVFGLLPLLFTLLQRPSVQVDRHVDDYVRLNDDLRPDDDAQNPDGENPGAESAGVDPSTQVDENPDLGDDLGRPEPARDTVRRFPLPDAPTGTPRLPTPSQLGFDNEVLDGVSLEYMQATIMQPGDPCIRENGEMYDQSKCAEVRPSLLPKTLREAGWKVGRQLGSGGFGIVYLLRKSDSSDLAALKVAIPSKYKRKMKDAGLVNGLTYQHGRAWVSGDRSLRTEAQIYKDLGEGNENVCVLRSSGRLQVRIPISGGRYIEKYPPYLLLNYYSDGHLGTVLTKFGERERDIAFSRALKGLNYVHSRGIVHYDLKPQNIMVKHSNDGNIQVGVCDFGLARQLDINRRVSCAGTPRFRAPEIELCCKESLARKKNNTDYCEKHWKESTQSDVWSFGVMILNVYDRQKCSVPALSVCSACGNDLKKKADCDHHHRLQRKRYPYSTFENMEEYLEKMVNNSDPLQRILAKALDFNPETRGTPEELAEAFGQLNA